MKKFARLTLLCFIPVGVGVVCFIVGNSIGNSTVTYVGMLSLIAVLPAMMLVFLIIGLILGSMGKLSGKTDKADETLSQKEQEQNMIDAVNSTSRFESRVNMAEYEMQHVAEGMKHAPKWGIALGLTFFFSLVALLIAATVLLIKGVFIGAIVCAGLFGGTLITTFIAMTISRAIAKNGDISKAKKITEGKVKTCYMVGTATTRTGGNRYRITNGETVRINSVTYRVLIDADGEEYAAISNDFYETDEIVTIAVMGKKHAKILNQTELKELNNSTPETK